MGVPAASEGPNALSRLSIGSLLARQIFFPAEYRSAVQCGRGRALNSHEGLQRWTLGEALKPTRLVVEAFQGLHLLMSSELGFLYGRLHHADGFIVDFEGNRVRVTILSAVRQREAGGILEAIGRSVHHFADHGEGSDPARADARRQQKIREADRTTLGCRGERAVEPPRKNVTGPDVVVCRHDEMREQGLRHTIS